MQQRIQLDDGSWTFLDPESLEEWAFTPGRVTPVLLNHDPTKLIGWADRVAFNQRQAKAMIFGELDTASPDARGVARLVRQGLRDGLSPGVKVSRGTKFYRTTGHYGDGDLVAFPELSVVWEPRIRDARWLGV